MGRSVVELKDKGFWCADGSLQLWLFVLVEKINEIGSVESWLTELRNLWYEQSQFGGSGCIAVFGDKHDQLDSKQILKLLEINQKAMKKVREFGDSIPLSYLNSTCGPGNYYLSECSSEMCLQVGEHFEALLDGTLAVDTTHGKYGRVIPFSE